MFGNTDTQFSTNWYILISLVHLFLNIFHLANRYIEPTLYKGIFGIKCLGAIRCIVSFGVLRFSKSEKKKNENLYVSNDFVSKDSFCFY